jgi:hypothetical protein
MGTTAVTDLLSPATAAFYREGMEALERSGVRFLIGGAYALAHYTGIVRHTKDLDVFLLRADVSRALDALAAIGCRTEITFQHWLGKAFHGDDFLDLIYSSGNGLCPVDEEWFTHARSSSVLGKDLRLCPPEEMIWQKAFVMERERFDGADVAHLLRACGPELDWPRLLRRFGPHGRLLYGHLIFFDYLYPQEAAKIPDGVMMELAERSRVENREPAAPSKVCRGPLVSRSQYLVDLHQWGYPDPRLRPRGSMTEEEVTRWTEAAFEKK